MRLRIIATNFTTKYEWLFKLYDENANEYFIMTEGFYKKHKLKTPITKRELDYLDKGQWIKASYEQIVGLNVVLTIQ